MEKGSVYSLWTFFIVHAFIYAVSNFFLLIINLWLFRGGLWFYKPAFFWLLLVVLHYFITKLIIKGQFLKWRNQLVERLNK